MIADGDGKLCVEIAGSPEGRPVVVCAGTPNSRHLFEGWIDDARSRDIRLIGYDRPGYGGSDPRPGYRIADGASHVEAIATALGIDRLAVWGFSGGGPHALACAALLPELVAAAATVGSIAPYGAPELDFFAGMGEDNIEDVELSLENPAAARRKTEQEREELLRATPEQLLEAWNTLLSPVDAEALTGTYAESMVSSLRDGLAPGVQGWWDDGIAHLSDWGFELSSIRTPVKLWHGGQDRFVPPQHGDWLAERIPGAEREFNANDGHLTLLAGGAGAVHQWLLSHF
jgi:pimeloyl-ACP methyl ester carboxylesterase